MDSKEIKELEPSKHKENNLVFKQIKNKWVIMLILLGVFFVIGIVCFLWKREIKFDSTIDVSTWGSFGEYIGGLLGTIVAFFSVYFLIKTLKSQITSNTEISNDNKRNTKIYTLQQFHDTFTMLVALYHDSINAFKLDNEKEGKKFFHEQVKKQQSDFNEPSNEYKILKEKAINPFNKFYTEYRERTSVYFRLLYRLFQLIDTSDIDEKKKSEYAKIIRCQLSEDEMFLLRYSAMTPFGSKMKNYINRYNLLKHLPIMGLLEFSVWRKKISEIEKNSLDSLFIDIRKRMCNLFLNFEDKRDFNEDTIDKKYQIKGEKIKDSKFKFEVVKNRKIQCEANTISSALDKFSQEDIQSLLEAFVQEIFVFSNFEVYAKISDMTIDKDINTAKQKEQDTIWITIENKVGYPLILSQIQLNAPQKVN